MHLLPHLQRACESLPLQLLDARACLDGAFDVDVRWMGEAKRLGDARAAVFALVGSFAEPSTYVRQLRSEPDDNSDSLVFEIVTGFVEGQSGFTPHGHTVRVRVTGVV